MEIHVLEIEADELAQTKSRGIEELQDRPIAPPERLGGIGNIEQARHFGDRQMRRHLLLAFRRRHQRRWIVMNPSLAAEESGECPERRELARDRRPRQPKPVQIRHEPTNGVALQVLRLQGRHPLSDVRGGEREELRQVAAIRVHGVG